MKRIVLIAVLVGLTLSVEAEQPNKESKPQPAVGKEKQVPGTKGGPMVFVPAGEFTMGMSADAALQDCQRYSSDCKMKIDYSKEKTPNPTDLLRELQRCDCKRESFENEEPAHGVYLDAYYIDKYEVTQGEYDECVRAGKCMKNYKYKGFTEARQPVVGVTWEQAKSYCEWAGKHLPTEAQWEKAARGKDGRMYPWGNQKASCELANYGDCKIQKTWMVGSKPAGASPYGALDMAGNVGEWVEDWRDDMYYRVSPKKNPTGPWGPSSGSYRVFRGGDWGSDPHNLQASYRNGFDPDVGGVRCSAD